MCVRPRHKLRMFLLAAAAVLVVFKPAAGPYAATLLSLRVGLKGGREK